jgi:hypothetical protein
MLSGSLAIEEEPFRYPEKNACSLNGFSGDQSQGFPRAFGLKQFGFPTLGLSQGRIVANPVIHSGQVLGQ